MRAVAVQSTVTVPEIVTSVVLVGTLPPQVAGSHHERVVETAEDAGDVCGVEVQAGRASKAGRRW